ncbi:phospholipase C, partial [Biomphalaria glabrata]
MADEEDNTNGTVNTMEDKTEEVFLNGEKNVSVDACNEEDEECEEEENELDLDIDLDLECNSDSNQIIPRRSSLMNKDGKKRTNTRKKTVSFSSMPTERKIAT